MKNFCLKILFTLFVLFISANGVYAIQFDILALPTDLFSICDNYFCFPEPSEISTTYVIDKLNSQKYMHVLYLNEVRNRLDANPELKKITQDMLKDYKENNKVNFPVLKQLSKEFDVKSIILISAYTTNDKTSTKRDLWEILEISSAFRTTYPFNLVTNVVLTDTINDVVMWSAKYNKAISDSNGYFSANNQTQAASHLEKIKLYYKENVSLAISQNIYLRFFPKDVKTFNIKKATEEDEKPRFVPNALEHLIKPKMLRELDEGSENTPDSSEDFIFAF